MSDEAVYFHCDYHPHVRLLFKGQDWCPKCMEEFKNRRPADEMTGDERAAECQRLRSGRLSQPFSQIQTRFEELVGRPVWTHELGLCIDALIERARTRQPLPRSAGVDDSEKTR